MAGMGAMLKEKRFGLPGAKKGDTARLITALSVLEHQQMFPEAPNTSVQKSVTEEEAQKQADETLRAAKLAELLPGGKSPDCVQLWVDEKNVEANEPDKMRAQAAEPTQWAIEASKHSYLSPDIKAALDALLLKERFTPQLRFLKQWGTFRAGLRAHLTAEGEALRQTFDEHQLGTYLADDRVAPVLGAPTGVPTGQLAVMPCLAGFDYATPEAAFTSERVAMHVMVMVGLAIDGKFQAAVGGDAKYFVDDHVDGFKPGPVKTFLRPLQKAETDYADKPRPRVAHNLDVLRCLVAARNVRRLLQFLAMMRAKFGALPKWKNLFGLGADARAQRFHLVSVMLTVEFDAGVTYGELAKSPEAQTAWDAYCAAPQGEPAERWNRDTAAARQVLGGKKLAKLPVKMLAEIQVLLEHFVPIRARIHDPYLLFRAADEVKLLADLVLALGLYRAAAEAGSVYTAAGEGQRDGVARLLDAGHAVDGPDVGSGGATGTGMTPLYAAAEQGHTDVVAVLLRRGAAVDVPSNVGLTPLYIACQNGHAGTAAALLSGGAAVDLPETGEGMTPLFMAAQKGHTEVVAALLKGGAAVDLAKKDGQTPLFVASWKGHPEIVQLLIKGGADVQHKTPFGTALAYAKKENHTEVVALLEAAGAK